MEGTLVTAIEGVPVMGHIVAKTLTQGDEMLTLELTYAADASSRPHRHEHESHCYLVSGRIRAIVGDESWEMGPGDACIHPIGVLHAMEAIEDSVVVEVKSPRPEPTRILT